jgi:hypothetical protein
MLILLIVPAVAGAIVTVPVPVGETVTDALAGLRVTVELAVRVVNAPVDAVVAPMLILLIEPRVAGAITTLTVPVGLIATDALAGLSVVVDVDERPASVLDAPALIAPDIPTPPVTINEPVPVVVEAVPALNVTCPLTPSVVKRAVFRTDVPIGVFSILPAYKRLAILTPPAI